MNIKRKVIAIVGPTASGKTAVAVKLAKKYNGEIVSADSRQVFRCLDIGTGKDLKEYGNVKYHLIDIKNPGEKFTLFDYLPLARAAIEDIFSRGKLPIIVGGTGLYVQALVEGFQPKKQDTRNKIQTNSNIQIPISQTVIPASAGIQKRSELDSGSQATVRNDEYNREQLENLSIEQLQELLENLDSKVFEKVDKRNPHRLIRAIEKAQAGEAVTKIKPDFEVLQIGLDWPREELYKKIDQRVEERFEEGMLSEAELLLKSGVDTEWLLGLGLEYKIMTSFLISNDKFLISNQIPKPNFQFQKYQSFEVMKQELKYKSHQYAKRQLTWFRRFKEIIWLKDYQDIEKKAKAFLPDK